MASERETAIRRWMLATVSDGGIERLYNQAATHRDRTFRFTFRMSADDLSIPQPNKAGIDSFHPPQHGHRAGSLREIPFTMRWAACAALTTGRGDAG